VRSAAPGGALPADVVLPNLASPKATAGNATASGAAPAPTATPATGSSLSTGSSPVTSNPPAPSVNGTRPSVQSPSVATHSTAPTHTDTTPVNGGVG
jgi:hypothetical protein